MNRFAVAAGLVATLFIATGWAQDDDPNALLSENTPAGNVKGGALSARAPGNWVQSALAQHRELINARVNGPRFGNPVEDAQDQSAAASDSSTSGTSGLGDLITQLTGSGALGSLANLFTGATGLSGTSTDTGASGVLGALGSSTGNTSGSLTGIPADALAMIEAAGIDLSELSAKSLDDDSMSGGIARLPSKDVVSRAQSQDDRKFHVRLVDSLLSTFFTALSVGFQTTEFIDSLTGFLRPIFIPPTPTDTGSQDSGGQDGGTTDGGGGSGTTGDGGGGIEDLTPSEGGSDDTGSIVRHVRPAPDGLHTVRVA